MVALRICVLSLAIVLGVTGLARADGPLAMDEPAAGLHLEIEGGCQVRPADGGGAACQSFAASADKSERFAVVQRPDGLLFYSVAIFAEREAGVGLARARRVSATMGEAVVGTPTEVTFGEQPFLRAQLRTSNGGALCFITADEGPDLAVIMFATEPASFAAMEPKAEAAMRTFRRTKKVPAPAPVPPADAPMSRGYRVLLTALLIAFFATPVVRFIVRAGRTARRTEKQKASEPRRRKR